jgi:hypothetical protein
MYMLAEPWAGIAAIAAAVSCPTPTATGGLPRSQQSLTSLPRHSRRLLEGRICGKTALLKPISEIMLASQSFWWGLYSCDVDAIVNSLADLWVRKYLIRSAMKSITPALRRTGEWARFIDSSWKKVLEGRGIMPLRR